MSKSPAFQFYPRDWIGDPEIMLMDWDARAMHLHMICIAWMQDDAYAIPDNDEMLMKWLHVTDREDWDKRLKPQIFSAWKKEDGRWIQSRLKREKNKQLETSQKRKDAANTRWGRKPSRVNANAMQMQCSSSSTSTSVKKEINKEKNQREKFVPPTVEEISDYVKTRQVKIDPTKFLSHYEANGWMRGKCKVKDWKACVRYWESNSNEKQESQKLNLVGTV